MKWIYSLFLIGCLLACSAPESNEQVSNKTKVEALVKYADHFQVFRSGDSLRLEIYQPDGQQLEYRQVYPIAMNSKPKLAALSATHIGMIAALNSEKAIVGVSNVKYLANPKVMRRVEQNLVVELGEESQIPVESIIQSNCDAIVYSGFGKTFPHQKQLQQVGIECIANYDWRESEPLGKAEWVLFFGCLAGEIDAAMELFKTIEADYLELKKSAKDLKERPSVLSGNLWGDNWHAPSGESFNAQLFKDAGAEYVYANTTGTGSQFLSLEKILADNVATEFWFNPGFATKAELLAVSNKIRLLGPFQKNQVFDYAQSGNVFWEESALYPNRVLSDLIAILHPNSNQSSQLFYYHRVE